MSFPAVIDLFTLDGITGFRLDGIDAFDQSGFAVASAGDVNGDGFDDIIIGAYGANPSGTSGAGESYVVFGSGTGFAASLDLASLDGTNGFRLDGIDLFDNSGESVASAGDVNGDGFDDIIIGAPNAGPILVGSFGSYASRRGETYVVFGKADGFAPNLELASLDGNNGFRLDGVDTNSYSGRSVASAGDVNGDGFDDIIIGAPNADPSGASNAGESYVVFGSGSGFAASIDLATLNGANGFRLSGIDMNDFSGVSVTSAGDVNGDGFDDIIIGARYADPGGLVNAGESYVVFGRANGFAASLDLASLDGTNGFRVDGIYSSVVNDISVARAGDVNGDGFDDLIIGIDLVSPGGTYRAGESYVVFGRSDGFSASFNLASLNGANGFRIAGVDVSDNSGASVASAGDVNGDGFDDIIIGARSADPNGDSLAGESYVVFGSGGGFAASFDLSTLDGTNGFRLDGIDANDRSGESVASAGDVNGDGFADIIIGARLAGVNGDILAGESYVVFGRAPTTAVVRIGSAAGQQILGGAFDDTLNGLGGDDVLRGQGGNDEIDGGEGNDTIDGGIGDDRIDAGIGDDFIIGGSGNDSALLRGGADIAQGGAGNDLLDGGGGDDNLQGGTGDDILIGGDGADLLVGNTGVDTMTGGLGNDIYFVDVAGDIVTELVNQGTDEVRATINYTLGNNVENLRLNGAVALVGTGNALGNSITAGVGSATLTGLAGNDILTGSQAGDFLDGGDDNDTLFGRAGEDVLNGGNGDDIINGQEQGDTLNGGEGNDILRGDSGNDIINGGNGNDNLQGGANNDTLNGDAGIDALLGGDGNDTLNGGDGNDTLSGDAGRDLLTGGLGADRFRFDDGHFAGLTATDSDRILDFSQSQGDRIDLSLVDAVTGGSDNAFTFIGSGAFTGVAGQLRFAQSGGFTLVTGDTNGDGTADFAIRVDGLVTLVASDFVL